LFRLCYHVLLHANARCRIPQTKKATARVSMLQHGWHTAAFFHDQFSFKREMDRTTEERAVILAFILQEMQNQNNKKTAFGERMR
jgi:hypothetical protein